MESYVGYADKRAKPLSSQHVQLCVPLKICRPVRSLRLFCAEPSTIWRRSSSLSAWKAAHTSLLSGTYWAWSSHHDRDTDFSQNRKWIGIPVRRDQHHSCHFICVWNSTALPRFLPLELFLFWSSLRIFLYNCPLTLFRVEKKMQRELCFYTAPESHILYTMWNQSFHFQSEACLNYLEVAVGVTPMCTAASESTLMFSHLEGHYRTPSNRWYFYLLHRMWMA